MITAAQLRAARVLLGIDQRQLAELSGLSAPTIQRMEASESMVRGNVDSLVKLITALEGAGIELIDEPGESHRTYVIDRNIIASNGRAGLGMLDNSITTEDYRAASLLDPVNLTNNTIVGNNHGISGGDNLAGVNNIIAGNSVGVKGVDGVVVQAETELLKHGLVKPGDDIAVTFGMVIGDEPFQTNILKLWKIRNP